jgi:hypothetical protein
VAVRLGGGAEALRLVAGPERGGERAGDVVARHAVVRELGGGPGHAGQQARQPGVQPGPLPRHQVAVHRLAQERVPEPVAVGPVGRQQLVARRLAQRRLVSVVGQAGGGPDQVVGAAAGHGGHPQHPLRRVRQAFHARQQQRGEPGRQRAVGVRRRGQELLGVVGVPFGPFDQGVEGGGGLGQRGARHAGQDLGQRGGRKRAEFDQRDHRQPEQLGDDAAQRVPAVQVVGAVRPDDRDALTVQHAGEERDQVARAGVGPVQVLDDQQDRAADGQLGQQAEHGAEHLLARQARPVRLLGLPVAVREQPGQHRAGLDGLLDARRRGAERVREREVGDAVPDLRALAVQHGEAVVLGGPHRLGDQAGLADAGVAADEPRHGAARRGVSQEGAQPG